MKRCMTLLILILATHLPAHASSNRMQVLYITATELADTVIESNVIVSVVDRRNDLRVGDGVTTGGVRVMRTDALTSMPHTVTADWHFDAHDVYLDDDYILTADNNGNAQLRYGSSNIWIVNSSSTSSVPVVSSATDGTNVLIDVSTTALIEEPSIYYSESISTPDWDLYTNAVYSWPPTGSVMTVTCPIPAAATTGYFVVRYGNTALGIHFRVPVHVDELVMGGGSASNITTNATASGTAELMSASAVQAAIASGGSGAWQASWSTEVVADVEAEWPNLDTDATDDLTLSGGTMTGPVTNNSGYFGVGTGLSLSSAQIDAAIDGANIYSDDEWGVDNGSGVLMSGNKLQQIGAIEFTNSGTKIVATNDTQLRVEAQALNISGQLRQLGSATFKDDVTVARDAGGERTVVTIGQVDTPDDLLYLPEGYIHLGDGDLYLGQDIGADNWTGIGYTNSANRRPLIVYNGADVHVGYTHSSYAASNGAPEQYGGLWIDNSARGLVIMRNGLRVDSTSEVVSIASTNSSGGLEIGHLCSVTETQGVAVGYGCEAEYLGIALGWATAGDTSVAAGYQANAFANGVALGPGADVSGDSGVAIGNGADASTDGVAIGKLAHGENRGVAIGRDADGYIKGVAIGYSPNATWLGVGIGEDAQGSHYGVAIGKDANGEYEGVGIGYGANGANTNLALGRMSEASGGYATAIGPDCTNNIPSSVKLQCGPDTYLLIDAADTNAIKFINGTSTGTVAVSW